jgi:S-DNA-T family DNA segregation ATPase FtsK/SpoIIIE
VRWPKISVSLKKETRVEPELPMGDGIRLQPQQPAPAVRREGLEGWSPSWTTAEAPKGGDALPPEDDDPSSRGAAFDRETDEGVRAVAQRFAPKSGVAAADAAEPKVVELPTAPPKQRQRSGYSWPSTALLRRQSVMDTGAEPIEAALKENARLLEEVLADFGIKGEVKAIHPGPVVTLYEYEPARGIKSARIIGLADDIARSMSAIAVRVAVVPGRNAIGIEVPNAQRETVYLREIFDSETFRGSQAMLPIALGKSIAGEAIIADLARMPHLLVAGTTGSGKSVGVNSMILSLLFKLEPSRCRLLLIDPKMLELSVYNRIPHLLAPVVTDPAEAVAALNWAVREMEERYKRMSKLGVRNIEAFNARLMRASAHGERIERKVQTGFDPKTGAPVYELEPLELEPLPYIVVVVDEFADLMAVAGKEIEMAVQRLAQMARAAGIHLVMATQRPSVDVITGTIKANFPSRISFKVASKIDSRTILNEPGAEQLLGRGDMLYSNGSDQALRVHGAFVSDDEVETVVEALRQAGTPNYVPSFADPDARAAHGAADTDEDDDALYARAVELVARQRKASTTYLQRQLGIGYNRAAAIMERLEADGIVGPAGHGGRREILVPAAA